MNNNKNISQGLFDRIENYISNEMNADEKDSFESELKADARLQQQVEEVKLLQLGIQEAELEKHIHSFHKTTLPKQEVASKPISLFRKLMVAAGIILIAGGFYWWLSSSPYHKLYAEYYVQDPGLITAMSTPDNYTLYRPMVDYKTGNYEVAIKGWQPLLDADPANDTLNYFMGASYLGLGKTTEAVQHFIKVKSNSMFYSDACWYTGLAYMKEKNMAQAKIWIVKCKHEGKDMLLARLNSLKQ